MKTQFLRKSVLVTTGVVSALILSACGGGSSSNYTFQTASADSYIRVDRMGEPGVATALLSKTISTGVNPPNAINTFADQRDAANRGDPINDARDFAGLFTTGPQPNALINIHYKLYPQLVQLGLVPCSTQTVNPPASKTDMDISKCVDQVAPVVLPDVLTYDLNVATSWPNGRTFDDRVIDRLLAAALLDLSATGQTIHVLEGVINPVSDETNLQGQNPSPVAFPHLRTAYAS